MPTYTYSTTTTTATYSWYVVWSSDAFQFEPKIPCLEYDFLGQLEFEG